MHGDNLHWLSAPRFRILFCVISMAVAFQGERYLLWQRQLMTQPAAMKSSSVGPDLTAAFACTGTAAVRVAGTGALSALALGGAGGAAESSSEGCWLVASVLSRQS